MFQRPLHAAVGGPRMRRLSSPKITAVPRFLPLLPLLVATVTLAAQAQARAPKPKWDVNKPPGPARTVNIDTAAP